MNVLELAPQKDPRRHLIQLFKSAFNEELGKTDPTPWGKSMRAMLHFKYVDTGTGEEIIEYPTVEAWQEQLGGFFRDEWAREKMGFSFDYFLKRFGSFVKYEPVKREKKTILSQWDTCEKCYREYPKGTEHLCERVAQ